MRWTPYQQPTYRCTGTLYQHISVQGPYTNRPTYRCIGTLYQHISVQGPYTNISVYRDPIPTHLCTGTLYTNISVYRDPIPTYQCTGTLYQHIGVQGPYTNRPTYQCTGCRFLTLGNGTPQFSSVARKNRSFSKFEGIVVVFSFGLTCGLKPLTYDTIYSQYMIDL